VGFVDLETSSIVILDDGSILTRCDQCRQMYAERKPPATPPCESCRVELQVENEDAARIFMMVRGQKLSNGDLNHLAVWAAIDGYGIKDRVGTFERVMATHYAIPKEDRGE
jgi:hypothetical protein